MAYCSAENEVTRDADRTARRELVLTRMPISMRGFLSRNLRGMRGMRMLAMTIARRCGRHARTVRWQASEYGGAEVDDQTHKEQKKTVPRGAA